MTEYALNVPASEADSISLSVLLTHADSDLRPLQPCTEYALSQVAEMSHANSLHQNGKNRIMAYIRYGLASYISRQNSQRPKLFSGKIATDQCVCACRANTSHSSHTL